MKRKLLAITICLLIFLATVITLDIPPDFVGNVEAPPPITFYVDDDAPNDPGPNNPGVSDPLEDGSLDHPFDMIQEGVDAAINGDEVYVFSGTYYEHVVVNETINLLGENRDTTIIDGEGVYGVDVVQVNAYGVEIREFTATGAGFVWGDAGIELNNVENCDVSDNKVLFNDWIGIYLYFSSGNIISNNTGSNNDPDIWLEYSDGNTITNNDGVIYLDSSCGNTITDNEGGICLYPDSNGNIVTSNRCPIYLISVSNNDISSNTATSIFLKDSNGNTIASNTASNNSDFGIFLWDSNANTVIGNTFSNNEDGIYLKSSDGNTITTNNASDNIWGIWLESSNNNEIMGNTIFFNDFGWMLESSHNNNIVSNVMDNMEDNIILLDSNGNFINNNDISSLQNSQTTSAICLDSSLSNTLTGNSMNNRGISIRGRLLEHWNTHNIDTSNTINGKNVYYWKDQTGGIIPLNAGQVILANCTNIKIENQDLSMSSSGIILGFSSNNSIMNTSFSYNFIGIYIENSNVNNFINNTISENVMVGIQVRSSIGTVFINCSIPIQIFTFYAFDLFGDSHVTLINTTMDDDVYFRDTKSTLTVKWYLHVNLKDYLGNPVPNANVRVEDNRKGSYNETRTTNSNGLCEWIIVTEYIEQKNKKTFYTPHRITVWNDTLVGYAYPDPVIDHSQTIHITLHNGTLLDLEPGWNLISLPRPPSNTDLETVFQSIESRYDAVRSYISSDKNDPWKQHHISKPAQMNDLDELNHTMGFWLHVTDPEGTNLIVLGDEITAQQSMELEKGWNLVGYPSDTSYNRTDGLNNLDFGSDINTIVTYNSTAKTWQFLDEENHHFEVGRGYWIHAKHDCVWEVPP